MDRGPGLRILLTHRYYWPDTPPYASMLRSLAEAFVESGHRVTVLTCQPSYRSSSAPRQPSFEVVNGVRVHRLPALPESGGSWVRRVFNTMGYLLGLLWHIVSHRDYDVVTAASFPPVLAGWGAGLGARLIGASFVYHCQDLHPEVGHVSSMLGAEWAYRALRRWEADTCAAADAVVVLSEDMRATVGLRPGGRTDNVRIINNFLPADFASPRAEAETAMLPGEGFRVVFAGNLGRFQGLEAVVEAAHLLDGEAGIHWIFVGEGPEKGRLEALAGALRGRTVHFLPHQTQAVTEGLVSAADLALVTLQPGVYRLAYPSKTLTYLALGRPLLVVVEEESELARMVRDEWVGLVVPPGRAPELAQAVRTAWRDRGALVEMGGRARRLYDERFAFERAVERWQRVLADL